MLELITSVQKHAPNGQIWIATHSIPVLSHFDPESIFWMENSKVSYAGNIPKKVLGGLLGDEERIERLADFLNLPAQFASNSFAAQCLLDAPVAATKLGDQQMTQIKEILMGNAGGKVRILDFGAGKGRLPAALMEDQDGKSINLPERLDYVAFDADDRNKAACENAIARIYGTATKRYFQKLADVLAAYDAESFDAVIMCNVLHEIDPLQWLRLFTDEFSLSRLLKKDGYLLIVEDTQIPVGEKPYQKGFLVLDTLELKRLFNIRERDAGFVSFDARNDGRLKAHRVPSQLLKNITAESRRDAIASIAAKAKEEIKRLRALEGTYQNGRSHGFWVQQLANAALALEEVEACTIPLGTP